MINKVFTVSEHLFFNDIVEIQTNISDKGLPTFEISGLVSRSVDESKKRVSISLENCGFQFPLKNILVNIAPASIPKSGTHYDLGIAVSIIKEKLKIKKENPVFIGELSFDGEVRSVENIYYLIISAVEKGFKDIYIPSSSYDKLIGFDDVNIYPISNLRELGYLDEISPLKLDNSKLMVDLGEAELLYPRINGNLLGRKAISLSLIGKHSLYIQGFPGVGKSMLAKSMVELAPNLTRNEFVNVNKIYSYSGISRRYANLTPPFRSPHPLSSYSSVFGSFNSKLLPGEVSLANKGILFLDEFPEFNRLVIEGLRLPLENKEIQLSRSGFKADLECDFILVAASNPCKCGYFNHPKISCTCSPIEIRRYQSRISGPILDRIDIKINITENSSKEVIDYKKYPNLEFVELKKLISEKRELRNKLLNINNSSKTNENKTHTIIVQRYMPNKIYNILHNELKNTSISERTKIKLINLIFTICLFNSRDQISIEDLFEGLELTLKN